MNDVLARIRVKETHGIRRFLYPLTAYVPLPKEIDIHALGLTTAEGQAVPVQVTPYESRTFRVDFAASFAPLQMDTDFLLTSNGPQAAIPDPLHVTDGESGVLKNAQERFKVSLGPAGRVSDVVYDDAAQLSSPIYIVRHDPDNKIFQRGLITLGNTEMAFDTTEVQTGGGPIAAWHRTKGVYTDGCQASMTSEVTACKSWVILNVRLEQRRPGDAVIFHLPLAGEFAHSDRTIFDTGIDGIYGHADYYGSFLHWYAPTATEEAIVWEVGKEYPSRTDYMGRVTSASEFQKQRWFHLVSGTKAIAVAVTKLPSQWQSLEIKMRGLARITFNLAEDSAGPAEFGVCYHFLNDVPAIAAATNPQSILLPPTVEVLPA